MNKENALKILNYWYTFNFLEQDSYPIETVRVTTHNYCRLIAPRFFRQNEQNERRNTVCSVFRRRRIMRS